LYIFRSFDEDKVEEFRKAMEVETTAKISSSPPSDENNKIGGYV